jgi:hypothetical protein
MMKPEVKLEMPSMAKLTPTQQLVSAYVTTAKKEPPRVEITSELNLKIEMDVPRDLKRGPEYEYAWLSIQDIDKDLYSGSKWEIVTRNNHSHAPDRYFGADGAVTYRGQNILAFCYRDAYEAEQRDILRRFNQKVDEKIEPTDRIKEDVAVADINSLGAVSPAYKINNPGTDTHGKVISPVQEVSPGAKYDFGET